MNIFFTGSIRGGRDDQPSYEEILAVLKKHGTVLNEHIGEEALSHFGETELADSDIYKREIGRLREASIVVAEVTSPSHGVGHLISKAVQMHKPVMCLYRGKHTDKLSAMVKGHPEISIFLYDTVKDVEKIIETHLAHFTFTFSNNHEKIQEILTFFHRANKLKAVPRFETSMAEDGDTVAEHSWRLALMTYLIGHEFKIGVDLNHAMALALLHDLAESKTGDIDAYEVISHHVSRVQKIKKEKEAMEEIAGDLSFGELVLNMWEEYEAQETLESKFVKALDKIEAYLHMSERGVKAYKPKAFHADYADQAVEAFDQATHHFPELGDLLHIVKGDLKQKFEDEGVEWKE